MRMNSAIDYLAYISFRLFSPLIRSLPLNFSLFIGRRLGDLLYYFDIRHKALAYSNIKTALGDKLPSYNKLPKITKGFYRAFGQNLIEIFLIPLINREYLNKYISIAGLDNIFSAFKRGKGVILLGVHEGSWELSNIISANLGFPFSLFIRNQRNPRLNRLLNSYRSQRGCRIIQRYNQTRQLIEALKKNESIGMSIDQGGRAGELVKFFGKNASMPTGAVKLALKYGAAVVPVFSARSGGPYFKIMVEPPFEIKKTGDRKKDIKDNLQGLVSIFEKYIRLYPQEYLWSYRIWKYGNERNVLILSDGRTGHLRQAQAVANIASEYLEEKGITAEVGVQEIKFKNHFSKIALAFSSCLAGKYQCQGCLWCIRTFLSKASYNSLIGFKPDVIISCGSSTAPVNFILARENSGKSIVVMRPSILSTKRFDLAVIPRHDKPPGRKNVVVTEGALNLIDDEYVKEQSEKLIHASGFRLHATGFYIGLLIGGDAKGFCLDRETVSEVIKQIKSVSDSLDADILVTTSRRTSQEVELIVKKEFQDYPRCKLLVIANEKNIPEAVGGILGLSSIVVTSAESISMVSEAASSKRYILVFNAPGLSKRHQRFLKYLAENEYIYMAEISDLSRKAGEVWRTRPPIRVLSDNLLVRRAIEKIL